MNLEVKEYKLSTDCQCQVLCFVLTEKLGNHQVWGVCLLVGSAAAMPPSSPFPTAALDGPDVITSA